MEHARGDGRARSAWAGELPAGEEAAGAQAYLEAEKGRLRVFRCPECEVRVAQEADVCTAASWERKVFAATFTRTFNVLQHEGMVCCVRCGVQLFPYDASDPAMLTLPLYWEGRRVFKKGPLRGVVAFDPRSNSVALLLRDKAELPLPDYIVTKLKDLEAGVMSLHQGRDVEVTFLLRVVDSVLTNGYKTPTPAPRTRQEWETQLHLSSVVQMYRDAGVQRFNFLFDFEMDDVFGRLGAQDFGLLVNTTHDGGAFVSWTDYNAEHIEELLLRMWMSCGGNLLLGNWFISSMSTKKDITSSINMEEWANACEHQPQPRNLQPAFAQLLRQGHYLGYWSSNLEVPVVVLEKLANAMDYRLLYPRWLFLHDFPPSVFATHARRDNDAARDPEFESFRPFAALAKDAVVPHFHPRATEEEEEALLLQREEQERQAREVAAQLPTSKRVSGKKQCKMM